MTNDEWIQALRGDGGNHEPALDELRSLLVRGLKASLSSWARRVGREFDALVEDFAQEAVLRVLDHLDSFRGESKFTTWAMKIAIRIALTELRRKRWSDFSLDQMMDMGALPMPGPGRMKRFSDPEARVERKEALAVVFELIRSELTERQRKAMMAVAIKGVPLEDVAASMGTNRNALYKLIHDARLKLKKAVEDRGLTVGDLLESFDG